MIATEAAFRSTEHPGGSFVVAATSKQFNDRAAAIHDAIVDNFGKGTANLTEGAHLGLHFANVIMAQEREAHYTLEERLALSRPLAVNAMKQVVQNGFGIKLNKPDVVESSVVVPVANVAHVTSMRRRFGSIARVPEVEQPTIDAIEPITLSTFLSPDQLSQISSFMTRRLLIQPIKSPFSSLQLWEADIDRKRPVELVDEVPIRVD